MKTTVAILVGGAIMFFGMAQATVIQEDFEGCTVGPGVPADWRALNNGPGSTWEIAQVDSNKVMKIVSGPPSGGGDGGAGPDNGTGWYVENFDMQTSLCILSGRGGGLAIGQFEGQAYVGNSYFVEVQVDSCVVGLVEEGLSAGSNTMQAVYLPPGSIVYNQWYDLRMVSTGTTFQVWFRPHSTAPWQPAEKIIEVPQDLLHPGHKSYVDGLACCYAQNGGGPSTVLFDDFLLEAAPFPAASAFTDDFENSVYSLDNWSQHWCVLDFPALDGSQVAHLTTQGRAGGIGIGLAKQHYTHNFVMRASIYVPEGFDGGVVWGWEGTQTTDVCYVIEVGRNASQVSLVLNEQSAVPPTIRMGTHVGPAVAGVYWYNFEVVADYERYYVWWWPRGEAQPASPVIDVAQDMAHPGYRLMNLGAIGLWVDSYKQGYFDDVHFDGTAVPSQNTSEGSNVTVEPEPGLNMTFDTVAEGGTTTVEISTEAPGGGPGGLEFQGMYYDIDTTCVYSGPITISFAYDDTGMTLEQEQNLRLMHWLTADQMWVDITVLPVDTVNNVISGVTDSLSIFAIASLPLFQGFLQPINMPPVQISVFKQKSTIPVKFKLLNAAGQPVPDAQATVWVQKVSNGVPGDVNETVQSTQPDGGISFRYDAGSGQYIFNLSSKPLSPGVYRVHARIIDGLMDKWADLAIR